MTYNSASRNIFTEFPFGIVKLRCGIMVITQGLVFNYTRDVVFNFPNMEIQTGEQWLVTGNSGSGKTTLLHLLSGLLSPGSGTIHINGVGINRLSPAETDSFRGKNIGLIFQKHYFIDAISMRQNLLSAQTLPGFKTDHNHIETLLETLGIKSLEHKNPPALSQGELQRFSVARALANKPLLLLADEPTSSLDDQNCHVFIDLIRQIADQFKTTLIIATHDARLKNLFTNHYAI